MYRKHQNLNASKYRQIHIQIETKIREAKDRWLNEQCGEEIRLSFNANMGILD